jgi:hypothetical protein
VRERAFSNQNHLRRNVAGTASADIKMTLTCTESGVKCGYVNRNAAGYVPARSPFSEDHRSREFVSHSFREEFNIPLLIDWQTRFI